MKLVYLHQVDGVPLAVNPFNVAFVRDLMLPSMDGGSEIVFISGNSIAVKETLSMCFELLTFNHE